MSDRVIQTACVVGGGSAGLLAALTLKRLLPGLEVSLVRSANVPVIGVGESTTPFVPRHLHQYLGLDQKEFFNEVKPSWKLGIRYEWGPANKTHFNYPFDNDLNKWHPPLPWVDGYYCLEDLQNQSIRSRFMEHCRSPILAKPNNQYQVDQGAAYHLDNKLLLAFLEKQLTVAGIDLIEGDVVDVVLDPNAATGAPSVQELTFKDGRTVSADLFVDASGFRSLLLGKALKQDYVSYASSLFCDKAIVGSFQRDGQILPYTTAETMDHGWCWRIEFEKSVTRGYVFSSAFCDEETAKKEMKNANPELGDDLRTISFPSGRYENFWVGNVAAVGNASGFVEPLEATALHLIVMQLQYLVQGLRDGHRRITPALQRL